MTNKKADQNDLLITRRRIRKHNNAKTNIFASLPAHHTTKTHTNKTTKRKETGEKRGICRWIFRVNRMSHRQKTKNKKKKKKETIWKAPKKQINYRIILNIMLCFIFVDFLNHTNNTHTHTHTCKNTCLVFFFFPSSNVSKTSSQKKQKERIFW